MRARPARRGASRSEVPPPPREELGLFSQPVVPRQPARRHIRHVQHPQGGPHRSTEPVRRGHRGLHREGRPRGRRELLKRGAQAFTLRECCERWGGSREGRGTLTTRPGSPRRQKKPRRPDDGRRCLQYPDLQIWGPFPRTIWRGPGGEEGERRRDPVPCRVLPAAGAPPPPSTASSPRGRPQPRQSPHQQSPCQTSLPLAVGSAPSSSWAGWGPPPWRHQGGPRPRSRGGRRRGRTSRLR